MPCILFICGSNHSRSPLAATFLQYLAQEKGCADISAVSAGLNTRNGEPLCPEVSELMAEYQCRPTPGGTRQLQAKMLKSADLVLCMTREQQQRLEKNYPSARNKTKTLMSILKREQDVFDPRNEGLERFRQCLAMMKPALQELLERLC